MAKKKKQKKHGDSELVSFRLEKGIRRLLHERAAEFGQTRANLFARVLVTRALTDASEAELRHELAGVSECLRRVRGDLATIALVMLVKLGNEDPEDAKEWVREVLS